MNRRLTKFARANRKDPTWSEAMLWSDLRRRQAGFKFRRQQPIGPYIVDFVCFEKQLIIELDGFTHDNESTWQRDMARQQWLESQGFRVLRFSDDEVRDSRDDVGNAVWLALGNG